MTPFIANVALSEPAAVLANESAPEMSWVDPTDPWENRIPEHSKPTAGRCCVAFRMDVVAAAVKDVVALSFLLAFAMLARIVG